MSIRYLSHVFDPASVAVIGASDRPRSAGSVVMRNLLLGGFKGPIMPVHPGQKAVSGVLAYPTIESLPLAPDLAVLCTPGASVPDLIDRLGARGTRAAVVIATGVDTPAMLASARPHGLRVLGPGSLGVLVPRIGLDLSVSSVPALPGKVALVSQSGGVCSAVLDWARPRGIGFSHFISLGNGDDIDFPDVIDYLANDPQTRAILLYIETIAARRNFMPAMRAAARNKPILLAHQAIDEQQPAVPAFGRFLSESLARPEACFNAAVRRSGALRVRDISELFGAVETLARAKPVRGNALAIVANGGGTAMMARAEMGGPGGGRLAELSEETRARLGRVETATNPVDLGPDAPPARYGEVVAALLAAPEVDAVLVIHAPNAMADGTAAAQAVIETQKRLDRPVLTSWLGEEGVAPARRLFAEAGLPTYDTPGRAVRAFRHLVNYQRNQHMLMETPPSHADDCSGARAIARPLIAEALQRPGGIPGDVECRAILAAYGISVADLAWAPDVEGAVAAADRLGYPVALSAAVPALARKREIGGMALGLETAEAVRASAQAIQSRLAQHLPGLTAEGFSVQAMVFRPFARRLMAGIACDRLFGPVLVFGEGGRHNGLVHDRTIGLPPLNLPLARSMIARTRVSPRLEADSVRPAADRDAIADLLIRLSQMLADNPEIVACDIDPLLVDESGVLALDARMRVEPFAVSDRRTFSILPYPAELEEPASLADGTGVLLRPIRPEDEPAHAELIHRMSPQDLRMRFFGLVREVEHYQLARMTQVDYDREMAFVAVLDVGEGCVETLGVVRTISDPDHVSAELAILVRSDLKGTGLGRILMDKMIRYHRRKGTGAVTVQVLAENAPMLRLARRSGFTPIPSEDPQMLELRLDLSAR